MAVRSRTEANTLLRSILESSASSTAAATSRTTATGGVSARSPTKTPATKHDARRSSVTGSRTSPGLDQVAHGCEGFRAYAGHQEEIIDGSERASRFPEAHYRLPPHLTDVGQAAKLLGGGRVQVDPARGRGLRGYRIGRCLLPPCRDAPVVLVPDASRQVDGVEVCVRPGPGLAASTSSWSLAPSRSE